MLRPREADALGAELAREPALAGRIGIDPHAELAALVGPREELDELLLLAEVRGDRRQLAREHLAGRPVDGDRVALLDDLAVDAHLAFLKIDVQGGDTRDARQAEAARDHCRMRCRTAAGREDPRRRDHPVEVIRARLWAHQDDELLLSLEHDRAIRVEHGAPGRGAGRRVEPLREVAARGACAFDLLLIEARKEELLDLGRLDSLDGLVLGDEPLFHHVGRDLDRGRGGALGRAGLEHVELAALDGELEVLRVAVMLLEPLGDLVELGVRLWQVFLHLRDLRRRPDPGDDVLALRVREVLAVELLRSGVRVTGERDACARVVAHVSEHHRHHAAGGPEIVGDLELLPVVLGALPEPRAEHRLDGEAQLVLWLGREWFAGLLPDDRLVLLDELLEPLRR